MFCFEVVLFWGKKMFFDYGGFMMGRSEFVFGFDREVED